MNIWWFSMMSRLPVMATGTTGALALVAMRKAPLLNSKRLPSGPLLRVPSGKMVRE